MKLGLVLEGGASRTLFSCGVLDALLKQNIMADYIIGASAGISYGVSYASKQYQRNLKIAGRYMSDSRYMGVRHLVSPKNRGYYNLDFVFDEIPNRLLPFDYDTFAEFTGSCLAVVTNMETGKAEYVEVSREDRSWQALRATCALPLLFPKIKLGDNYYMDGGVADSIPFEKAMEDGCDKVIVVLTRERDYVKTHESTSSVAEVVYRKYPDFVEAMRTRADRYNACLEKLRELEKNGRVIVIAPDEPLGVGRVESDPKELLRIYKEGFIITKRLIPQLKEYLTEQ